MTDCRASQTITSSLINSKDVMEKVTIIETENSEESMKSNLECTKTNRMGGLVTITVTALFVKGLPQNLLGWKSVNRENIREILDSDHDICWLYPLDKNHEQHQQESIEWLKSKQISIIFKPRIWIGQHMIIIWLDMTCGIEGRDTFWTAAWYQHSIGLENLVGKKGKRDQKLQNNQRSMDRPRNPWARCTWFCTHYPSHQLQDITILSSSLTATVEWDGWKQNMRPSICLRGDLLRLQTCTSTTPSSWLWETTAERTRQKNWTISSQVMG